MEEEINCTDTKKRMTVGKSERVTKAKTSLVLSFAPMIFFFLSNRSFTRFRTVRKRRRRSRMTLIFIKAKIRMLLEIGRSKPRSKTLIPKKVRKQIATNRKITRYRSRRRLIRSFFFASK
jgi:hypothetical protein